MNEQTETNRVMPILMEGKKKRKKAKKDEFTCPFCLTGMPHLAVVLRKDGDVHVHAPFDEPYTMHVLVNALQKEIGKRKTGGING